LKTNDSSPTTDAARKPWVVRKVTALVVLLSLLALAAPLFVRMPIINDISQHDLCAWIVLRGGAHYRDCFEPSPPGILWIHMLIRSMLGWSSESIRLADLSILSLNVLLLLRLAKKQGVSPNGKIWLAIALFAFYLSTPENCHCQRDSWMLLPCLAALTLRQSRLSQRLRSLISPAPTIGVSRRATELDPDLLTSILQGGLEGCCWGIGFWIKPFIVVPAAACWAVTLLVLRRHKCKFLGSAILDLIGVGTGFLALLAGSLLWLHVTGALPYYWDIVTNWLPEYRRLTIIPGWTPVALALLFPWSLGHLIAMPLACRDIYKTVIAKSVDFDWCQGISNRALTSAFYLGWLFQSSILQHGYSYQHVPAILLALLVASQWCGFSYNTRVRRMNVCLVIGAILLMHPLLRWVRLTSWLECVRGPNTPSLMDRLSVLGGANCAELDGIAEFLGTEMLTDRELTCHASNAVCLYQRLGIRPSTRFSMLSSFIRYFPEHSAFIREQLETSQQKFVVTDLTDAWSGTGLSKKQAIEEWPDKRLALPPAFPAELKNQFPWSEPVVFRSGRYFVHRVTHPSWPN
jgi:hypothetical protein